MISEEKELMFNRLINVCCLTPIYVSFLKEMKKELV